jgi:DNA-binding Lrp family transcriptional regulator
MDTKDLKIISQLQQRADIPLAELSRKLGMSKTTCWNRLQRLEEKGVIEGRYTAFNREAMGLPVVVFLSITVGKHSSVWMQRFSELINATPEIIEAHRLTGEGADYQLKIVSPDIETYDKFQQQLIGKIEFTSMSTRISLKEIKQTPHLPLTHLEGQA